MFLLKDVKGNLVENVCILQYHVSNEEGRVDDVEVQKHGNSKFTNPKSFYPVKKRMFTAMKDSIKKKGSQGVYNDLRKKAGGVFETSSVSDIPEKAGVGLLGSPNFIFPPQCKYVKFSYI